MVESHKNLKVKKDIQIKTIWCSYIYLQFTDVQCYINFEFFSGVQIKRNQFRPRIIWIVMDFYLAMYIEVYKSNEESFIFSVW